MPSRVKARGRSAPAVTVPHTRQLQHPVRPRAPSANANTPPHPPPGVWVLLVVLLNLVLPRELLGLSGFIPAASGSKPSLLVLHTPTGRLHVTKQHGKCPTRATSPTCTSHPPAWSTGWGRSCRQGPAMVGVLLVLPVQLHRHSDTNFGAHRPEPLLVGWSRSHNRAQPKDRSGCT